MNNKQAVWGISILLLILGFFAFNRSSCAQQKQEPAAINETEALKQQVAQLSQRITQLEGQLSNKGAQPNQMANMPVDDDWDPFASMNAMNQMMNRMMAPMGSMMSMDAFNPRIDIKEDGNHYVITMDIPGMDKDNIDVKVENGNLLVSGERSTDTEDKNQGGKVYRHERSFGHFMRAVPLPKDAKTEDVDASYSNGVLTIKVGRDIKNMKPTGQKILVK